MNHSKAPPKSPAASSDCPVRPETIVHRSRVSICFPAVLYGLNEPERCLNGQLVDIGAETDLWRYGAMSGNSPRLSIPNRRRAR